MLLGIPGDSTHANNAEANRVFWGQPLIPLVQRSVAAMSEWLTPGFGRNLELRPDIDSLDALAPDRDAQWARLQATTFLTDDEKRSVVGYGPKPQDLAHKYNPNHHPVNGQFTSGPDDGNVIQTGGSKKPPSMGPTTPAPKPPSMGQPSTPNPNNVKIRNKDLAGQKHPVTGVPFDKEGFPDFKAAGAVKKEVNFPHSGDDGRDFATANRLAGYGSTPLDSTWHHHQDGNQMQLVDRETHRLTGHTGSKGLGNLPGKK
jgi:DNase/tRNase domain of colicin-like bacteriocin/Phage portal protein